MLSKCSFFSGACLNFSALHTGLVEVFRALVVCFSKPKTLKCFIVLTGSSYRQVRLWLAQNRKRISMHLWSSGTVGRELIFI